LGGLKEWTMKKRKSKKTGPHFVLASADDPEFPNHYLLGPFKSHEEAIKGVQHWWSEIGDHLYGADDHGWSKVMFFEFGRNGPKEARFKTFERIVNVSFGEENSAH
jgi:hypothetical protein